MPTPNDPTTQTVQDADDLAMAAQFSIDLKTQGGQSLVDLMEAQLADRMEQLAKGDDYCIALMNVMRHVGYQLSLASGKQAKLMQQLARSGE